MEALLAGLGFDFNFVVPEPEPPRPRAVSSFSPFFGIAIPPLRSRSLSPDRHYILLPYDERSQQQDEDELEQAFDSIFL